MNNKILKILIPAMIVGVILSVGITISYFQDVEKSENNVFGAGTLDLKVNEVGGAGQIENLLPGDEFEKEIELENVGSLPMGGLLFKVDIDEDSKEFPPSQGFFDEEESETGISSANWIANHVVISEIQIVGEGEWIELYNPTNEDVDLSGWQWTYFASTKTDWNDPTKQKPLVSGNITAIKAYSFFLFRIDGNVQDADGDTGYVGLPNTLHNEKGTVTIFNGTPSNDTLIDAIGWGEVSLKEGNSAQAPGLGKSLERKSGPIHDENKGNGFDTNDNARDFILRESPQPQNSSSQPESPY